MLFYEKWNFMWKSLKINCKNLENMMSELQINLDKCIAEIEMVEKIENENYRIPLMNNLGSFITDASNTLQSLHRLFDDIDKDIRLCKKYFGDTTITSTVTSYEEDPWCSFFSVFVNFANMHRLASFEIEEWKKAEERLKKSSDAQKTKHSSSLKSESSTNSTSTLTSLKSTSITKSNNHVDNDSIVMLERTRSTSLESTSSLNDKLRSSSQSSSMIDIFKKRMLIIRKNADATTDETNCAGDSDGSEDGAW
jgi:hypothetical protein